MGKAPAGRFARPAAGLAVRPAWGAEVVSSNIVGYNKMTFEPGFAIVGTQFFNVGADVKDLQELFGTDHTLPGITAQGAFQTELRLWREGQYQIYGWVADGQGSDPDLLDDASYDAKWVDKDSWEVAENIEVAPGEAFWIKTPANGIATMSGEVKSEDKATLNLSVGFVLASNPFPEKMDIQKVKPDANVLGINAAGEFQTELRLWREGQYKIYGWVADGQGSDPDLLDDASYDAKWVDKDSWAVAENVDIEIGEGFWIKTLGTGSIEFTK